MTDDWDAMATRTRTRKDDGSEVTITETTKWQYSERFWLYEFAEQAMQGCKQNPAMYHWSPGKVAEVALEQADALLAELRKREADDA